jgi:hypothetical protein
MPHMIMPMNNLYSIAKNNLYCNEIFGKRLKLITLHEQVNRSLID